MTLTPRIYLAFNGQCEAAFKFYERCFGGTIVNMFTWGGSPMEQGRATGMGRKDHACEPDHRRDPCPWCGRASERLRTAARVFRAARGRRP